MSTNWKEKRQATRRQILDRFSFYICVPKLGYTRHQVNDISEMGIGIDIETLGEFKLSTGEVCELHFYLNQSLYLPLEIEVKRTSENGTLQNVGAVFKTTPALQAFQTLVKLVDQMSEFGEIQP